MKEDLAIFEDYEIRRVYDAESETWYFSVVDVVQVLTQKVDYQTARKYWNKLKQRLTEEGSETVTNCHRLKMRAQDSKQRITDVATAETLLRLVQAVHSPKAEPIKLWLARWVMSVCKRWAILLDRWTAHEKLGKNTVVVRNGSSSA
jgi:DNA-damage-inducible protein D